MRSCDRVKKACSNFPLSPSSMSPWFGERRLLLIPQTERSKNGGAETGCEYVKKHNSQGNLRASFLFPSDHSVLDVYRVGCGLGSVPLKGQLHGCELYVCKNLHALIHVIF